MENKALHRACHWEESSKKIQSLLFGILGHKSMDHFHIPAAVPRKPSQQPRWGNRHQNVSSLLTASQVSLGFYPWSPTPRPRNKATSTSQLLLFKAELKAVLSDGCGREEVWASSVLLSSPVLSSAPSVCFLYACSWGLTTCAHRSGGGSMDALPFNTPFVLWCNSCFLGAQVIRLLFLFPCLPSKCWSSGWEKHANAFFSLSSLSPNLPLPPSPSPCFLSVCWFFGYKNSLSNA